ncbi:MAG: M4 family metallopeptidase [Burkholderiaceae bacterium]|nr:M4 family metallopeptidase [Burkholderiaceae bacterium]
MLRHLADTSQGEHREMLLDQIAHSSQLRGQRAAASVKRTATPKVNAKRLLRQIYDAKGQTFLPGTLLRDEDDPPTRNETANQAYDNIGIAMQFFATVLGHDSADGKGMRIDASVHYGYNFANAMWTGKQMLVGDGDGKHVKNLAGSLGIIAHEFAHGISQHLIKGGLGVVQVPGQPPTLKGEAGALNESFSDVCASMVKQWHAGEDVKSADWLLGEDILAPHVGKAIRSLKDPGNAVLTWREDDQIKDYRRFKPTDDAHKASGIANYAFYTAAMKLEGRSWEALGPVWLKGFDKLRARATFLDAAHATMSVAATLHGKGSATHEAVKSGWKKANVLS